MNKVTKSALINACATAFYVTAVGTFMYLAGSIKFGKANTFLVPIAVLLLLVFSAALTGFLLFGKPAQWYVDGKKSEALSLITQTLGFFFVITLAALILLFAFAR